MYINPIDEIRDDELMARGLPELAYIDNSADRSPGAAPVLAVKRGESGYYPIFTKLSADELNLAAGVSASQREAMKAGSMFGWHAKGAFPSVYIDGAIQLKLLAKV